MAAAVVEKRTGKYGEYYGTPWQQVSRELTEPEMQVNAKYIYKYLTAQGWTINAIAGALGNMQCESAFNPGRWQGDKLNEGPAYGLIQWDGGKGVHYKKHTQWAVDNGYADPSTMDCCLDHLVIVKEWVGRWHNTTFNNTAESAVSWSQYTISTESAYKLACIFCWNAEGPYVVSILKCDNGGPNDQKKIAEKKKRGDAGVYWYDFLVANGATPLPEPEPEPEAPPVEEPTSSSLYVGSSLVIPYIYIKNKWQAAQPHIYIDGKWLNGLVPTSPSIDVEVPPLKDGKLTIEQVEALVRSERPEDGNKYYISHLDGGYNGYDRGYPKVPNLTALCNCTAFAAGAFNEAWYNIMVALGKTPDKPYTYNFKTNGNEFIAAISNPNAYNWGDSSVTGLEWVTPDKRPPLGGIAVWGDSSRDYDNMKTNHVAFISRVSEDGNSVTFLQSGWEMPIDTWTCNKRESTRNTKGENMWWFQNPDFAPEKYKNAECYGFIVNPAVKEALGE